MGTLEVLDSGLCKRLTASWVRDGEGMAGQSSVPTQVCWHLLWPQSCRASRQRCSFKREQRNGKQSSLVTWWPPTSTSSELLLWGPGLTSPVLSSLSPWWGHSEATELSHSMGRKKAVLEEIESCHDSLSGDKGKAKGREGFAIVTGMCS